MNRIIAVLFFVTISYLTYGQNYTAIKTINRQINEINAIATCDKYFATASYDKTLFVWDYNGKKMFKYSVYIGKINTLCFIPDSELLLAAIKEIDSRGIERHIIKCFDISGKIRKEFIDTTLTQTAVDQYYQENTAGSRNAIIEVSNLFPQLDIKKDIKIPRVKFGLSHIEYIQSISVSPNQKLIATLDHFKILKIWDINGKIIKSFQIKNNKKDNKVYFTSDSTLFITPNITLNLKSNDFLTLENFGDYTSIPLKNKTLYCRYDFNQSNKNDKLYDLQTNSFKDTELGNVYTLDVSTSGDKLAILGVDGLIRIRNINGELISTFGKDRTEVITFQKKQITVNSKITTISLSQNGDYLISGDIDGKVTIWKNEK